MTQQHLLTVEVREAGVECVVSLSAYHQCPYKDELDQGVLELCWRTTTHTIEMHSLAEYIESWTSVEISHEDLVAQIWFDFEQVGVAPVEVVWHGVTAGMPVAVRKAEDAVLRESVDRPHPSGND